MEITPPHEILRLFFEGATAVGTLLAAGSLYFLKGSLDAQKQALDNDYAWRETRAAIEMLRDWNEKVSTHRDSIMKLGRVLYGGPEGADFIQPIRGNEAEALWNADPNSDDISVQTRAQLNSSLLSLLNYFEYLSSAYLNGSVAKTIIKESFEDTMDRWYKSLQEYIWYVDLKTGKGGRDIPVTWKPYCDLMKSWREDRLRPSPPAFKRKQ